MIKPTAIFLALIVPSAYVATHEWKSINGRHWQVVKEAATCDVSCPILKQDFSGMCPRGMVRVSGLFKLGSPKLGSVEELQKTTCSDWISRDFPERCAEFDRDKWLAIVKQLPTRRMEFCEDRFEYPNIEGQNPIVFMDWYDAKNLCKEEGKRLCTEDEWTFACEGEEAMPYPYGYKRDAEACNIDKPWRQFDAKEMMSGDPERVKNELDRLWQGEPSGTRPGCVSPFGVYDTTGNTDEWTQSSSNTGNPSIFKGGYWGPIRGRCRPSTRIHGPTHTFYQEGVRCCSSTSNR